MESEPTRRKLFPAERRSNSSWKPSKNDPAFPEGILSRPHHPQARVRLEQPGPGSYTPQAPAKQSFNFNFERKWI